jgi:hypothetical protein
MSYSSKLNMAMGIIQAAADDLSYKGLDQVKVSNEHFQFGDYPCEGSPTKYCMYTNHDYDSCIFCYQPSERK